MVRRVFNAFAFICLFVAAGANRAAVQSTFEHLYGDRLRAANTPGKRLELAKQVLSDAKELSGDPDFQFVLFTKSYDLASESGGSAGFSVAIDAAESLGNAQPMRRAMSNDLLLTALEKIFLAAPASERSVAFGRYIDKLEEVADAKLNENDFKIAIDLYEHGASSARSVDRTRSMELSAKLKRAKRRQSATARANELGATLQAQPDNSKAATELAELLLLKLDQPELGNKVAEKSDDKTLARMAALAAKPKEELAATEAVELGDWYRQQSKTPDVDVDRLLHHAKECYARFLAAYTNEDRRRLDVRLALREVGDALAANNAEPHVINLLQLIDTDKDAVDGKWTLDQTGLSCDGSGDPLIEIPFRPPVEYDFRIEFTRNSGDSCIVQNATHRGHAFQLYMGGAGNTVIGLNQVRGVYAFEGNATTTRQPGVFKNGQRYRVVLQVRKDGVTAMIDGKVVVRYKTNYSDLSLPQAGKLPDDALGLGTHESATTFHSIELLEVTGSGRSIDVTNQR